jgi:small conductance mechanosensitive channel
MEKLNEKIEQTIAYFQENWSVLVVAFSILIIGFLIANFISTLLTKRLKAKVKNSLSVLFIAQIIRVLFKIATFLLFLSLLGFNDITTKILAGAGILTFIVGFAFKDIGENFLAGIILAFKSPFQEDDLIESEGIIGYVKELRVRETVVKTTDGKDVFIPNSQILKNPLINYTIDGFLRYDFTLGLDYSSDVSKAISVILDSLQKVEGVIQVNKIPTVVIDEFAASTINLKILFWIDTSKSSSKTYHLSIKNEVMKQVLSRLTEEGFNLPSNIVEIKQYEG